MCLDSVVYLVLFISTYILRELLHPLGDTKNSVGDKTLEIFDSLTDEDVSAT